MVTGTELAVIVVLALAALSAVVVAVIVGAMVCRKLEAGKKFVQQKLEAEKKYKAYWSKNRVRSRESRKIGYLVHELVNRERENRGVPSLAYDHHLAFIARGHSRDMAHYNYLGHVNRQGESPTDRARRKGYRFDGGKYIGVGENCYQLWGTGQNQSGKKYRKDLHQLAIEAVRGWMNSPGHRGNILNANYQVAGVGFARSRKNKGKVYLTQKFFG